MGHVGRETLAEGELRWRAGHLDEAVRHVLAQGQAGQDAPRLLHRDVAAGPSDDGDDLDLPVDELTPEGDVGRGPGDRAGELGEGQRRGRRLHAALGGMVGVVEPDGEHLSGSRHRGPGRRRPPSRPPWRRHSVRPGRGLGAPGHRGHRIGEGVVARQARQVVPGAVHLEGGPPGDVEQSEHPPSLLSVDTAVLSIDMTRATAAPPPAARARRPSEGIVADLLDAAAVEFAAHGFAGASTRRIAQRAGAHQPQINYHFTSKEQLWRATVDHLFSLLDTALPGPGDGRPLEQEFVDLLRAFLRFSADHPELDRIINLEATDRTDRLEWLVTTHLRPRFEGVATGWRRLRAAGRGADLSPGEVWEVITSYGAMHFANAPMLSLLGIQEGDGRSESDAHTDRVLAVLLPAPVGRARRRSPGPRCPPTVGAPPARRYRVAGERARRPAGRDRGHGRPDTLRRAVGHRLHG